MPFLCRLLGHAAMPRHHRNHGLDFAICGRCGYDLIRETGAEEWRELPPGRQVVWRMPDAASAAAVAARMARGPVPRRHRPRFGTPDDRRSQPVPRPRRLRGRTVLFSLCGKFVLASIADQLFRPAPAGERRTIIYLPAPGAAPRSRGRSPRAWWPERSASPPCPGDRRGIW